MTKPPSPSSDGKGHKPLLSAVLTGGGALFYLLAPLAAPVLLLLILTALLVRLWVRGQRAPWRDASIVIKALAVVAVYLLVNVSWSLSQSSAARSVALFIAIIAVLHLIRAALHDAEGAVLRAMAIGVLAAMGIAGVFLCLEAFSGQWVHRFLISHLPLMRADPRHMRFDAGWVTFLEPYLLNRSMTGLVLLFWPAMLIIGLLARSRHQHAWLLIGAIPVVVALLRSVHGSSKTALIGSAVIYGIFQLSPWFARRLAAAGWVAATLLVVPMASLAYSHQLYLAGWLPPSAQQRVVIWGYTSDQIPKAPLLGAGISTARALNEPDNFDLPRAPGTSFPLTTGLHSHNAFLQIWYETGAVGALMLLGLGLVILWSITQFAPYVQSYLFATFTACALLSSAAFSIWAPWFMATLAFAAVFAALGVELSTRESAPGAAPALLRDDSI